jgi:hypothetical protein
LPQELHHPTNIAHDYSCLRRLVELGCFGFTHTILIMKNCRDNSSTTLHSSLNSPGAAQMSADARLSELGRKRTSYPGEHEAIISQELWDEVYAILQESPRARAANARAQTPALLKGLIFTEAGWR